MIPIPGTNYRIRYDEEGLPDVFTWMTPVIKNNIVHYGDTIFLDARIRQYNQLHWPYISITIKDGEFRGRLTSESICVAESLDIYAWIVKE